MLFVYAVCAAIAVVVMIPTKNNRDRMVQLSLVALAGLATWLMTIQSDIDPLAPIEVVFDRPTQWLYDLL